MKHISNRSKNSGLGDIFGDTIEEDCMKYLFTSTSLRSPSVVMF